MSRPMMSELERLAQGRAIAKDAFLALLADANSQEDLARIAQAYELLEFTAGEEVPPPVLEVSWQELADYAEGTLADPLRRQAVEQFLARQAPEMLRLAEDTPTEVGFGGDTDRWSLPPDSQPKNESKGEDTPHT